MRPLLHAFLVNGRTGDPAVYVEEMFESRAFLFDIGDLSNLPTRKIQRLEHVFVSHAHLDHFFGFDRLLRVLVGQEKTIRFYGPKGFITCVAHKLAAYCWNLVDRFEADLAFEVTEVDSGPSFRAARMRLKTAFAVEPAGYWHRSDGALPCAPGLVAKVAILDHGTPCLAFSIQEAAHVNIWKSRLDELGLRVGAWLRGLRRALIEHRGDDFPIVVETASGSRQERIQPLGALRSIATVTPGQKIAYVTDAADTIENREAIVQLVSGADLLFIEAPFAAADAALATDRAHLTTSAAGAIARAAGVRRLEPFHFSPRYAGREAVLLREVRAEFLREGPTSMSGNA